MSFWGGVAGAAGSIIGGALGASSAKDVNREQIEYAKNKYQYQTADMKKAGLNPMLAMSQAPQQGPALHNPGQQIQQGMSQAGANLSSGINSAAAMKQAETASAVGQANIAIASEQIINLAATRNWTYAQTQKIDQEISNLVGQLKLTKEQTALAFSQTQQTRANTYGVNLTNEQKQILTRFYSQNKGSLVAKDMNMQTILKSVMPGLDYLWNQFNKD